MSPSEPPMRAAWVLLATVMLDDVVFRDLRLLYVVPRSLTACVLVCILFILTRITLYHNYLAFGLLNSPSDCCVLPMSLFFSHLFVVHLPIPQGCIRRRGKTWWQYRHSSEEFGRLVQLCRCLFIFVSAILQISEQGVTMTINRVAIIRVNNHPAPNGGKWTMLQDTVGYVGAVGS